MNSKITIDLPEHLVILVFDRPRIFRIPVTNGKFCRQNSTPNYFDLNLYAPLLKKYSPLLKKYFPVL